MGVGPDAASEDCHLIEGNSRHSPRRIALVLVEMLLVAVVVLAGAWSDRAARANGPEAALAEYASAVHRHDLEGALGQVAPEIRSSSAQFVQWQLGNSYTLLESAVRGPSIIEGLRGGGEQETTIVVTVDIQEEGGARWRTTEELPVIQSDGRWYLSRPLLLP